MKKILKTILIISLLTFPFFNISYAQDNEKTTQTGSEVQTNDETKDSFQNTLNQLLPNQTQLFGNESDSNTNQFAEGDLEQDILPRVLRLLVTISGVAITLIFTYVAFQLAISRGDEAKLTSLKNTFTQIIIGTVLILSAFAIVVGILQYFDSLR